MLIVYNNSDRPCKITISDNSGPVDFSAATRMVLSFRESDLIADSDVDADLIMWDAFGNVTFNLGNLGLEKGFYTGLLAVYDPAHPDGQVITHPEVDAALQFKVVGVVHETELLVQNDLGTIENANAYVSVSYFLNYHQQRGRFVDADNEKIKNAIIKASDYIDYRFTYTSSKLNSTQSTEFPRSCGGGIPRLIKEACCEYANACVDGELEAQPVRDESGMLVKSALEKIGPISTMYSYYAEGGVSTKIKFPAADEKIKKSGYLANTFFTNRV